MAKSKKQDKGTRALIFIAALSGVCVLLGLVMIFTPDGVRKAQRLADAAAVYLIEAPRSDQPEAMITAAYDAQVKALSLAPSRSDLWVRLAYTAVAAGKYERAEEALDIAYALDPSLDIAALKHRMRKARRQ